MIKLGIKKYMEILEKEKEKRCFLYLKVDIERKK